MSYPVIGITVDSSNQPGRYSLASDYCISVEKAGGLPLLIPYRMSRELIPELVDKLDGILFTGGDDLDPALYSDEEWHPEAVRVDPARPAFELALVAEVERRRLPALGICLGSQMMNVSRGGTLHQFLPDCPRENAIEHRRVERERPEHPVRLDPESALARAIGRTEIMASTYHKQASKKVGRGLRVVATAPDGVIEGFEDPTLPLFAGVQWHPERQHEHPEHLAVFKLLVERSRESRNR